MKPKSTLRSFLAIAGSSLLAISSASAATLYWDQNGTTALFGTAGGTWDAIGSSTWNADATGANGGVPPGILSTATTTSDIINFGSATASSLLSGVIKVSGTVDSGNMTYGTGAGNIQLSGGTLNLAAATTITVNNTTNTITSVISGAGTSLTKAGTGFLVLSGANTYTGNTAVNAGTLQFTNTAALYSGNTADWINTKISVNSGATLAVNVGGTGEFSTTDVTTLLTGIGGVVATNGLKSGALIGFDTSNASGGSFTIADNLANSTGTGGGAVGVSALGTKTLVLSGANTNTGTTRISGGATLVLDYGTNDNSKVSDTANNLVLNGGNLVLRGGTHEEVVLGTTMSVAGGNFVSREVGSTATINLNAFTLTSTQATVSFGAENIAKTDRLNSADGILGAWFTVGSHWAINSGSTTVAGATVPGTGAVDSFIRAYSGYTDFSLATGTSENTNFQLLGAATLTGIIKTNTLRIEGTADDQILDIGTNPLQVSNLTGTNAPTGSSGGILYAGGANGNYTISGSATPIAVPPNPALGLYCENPNGQAMLINTYTGTLTITARIGNGSSPIVKTGEGTLVLGQNNSTQTGAFRVYQGVLRLTNNGGAGTVAAGIIVQKSAALELANTVNIGAKALTITGNGVSNAGALRNVASNTSSYAGEISIGSGHSRINSDASGALTLTGGVINAANADVTFGGAGNTTVDTLGIKGTGNLIKDGGGTLTLSTNNSYTGATSVNGGTLVITGATQATSAITVGATGSLGLDIANSITASAATVTLGGTVTVTGTPTLASYTLLTASSIGGTPVLSPAISGYTLVIDGGNTLKLNSTGAPVGYAAWQSANSTGQAINLDHDNDGVSNGVEFFIYGPNANSSFTALPGVTNTLGTLSVTWTKHAGYTGTYGTDFVVETSDSLTGIWTTEILSPTLGFTVAISSNNVTYTFPAPLGTKKFARLKVTGP